MTTLAVDKNAASSAIDDLEYDEEEHGEHHPHRNSVHHKLRASSSIMQLKKLLGKQGPLNGRLEASYTG
jgi:pyruvate carboxylase